MPRALLALASIALTVFALADCIQADPQRVRGIPTWAWILLIVLVPWVGPITWLLVSRGRTDGVDPRSPRPLAPDDDPEFLRRLAEENRRRREQGGADGRGGEPGGPLR